MKRGLSWLVYPLLIASGLGAVRWATHRGVTVVLVLTLLQLTVFGVVALLERWMPEHRSWNVAHGDVRTDALYFLVSGVLLTSVVRVVLFGGVSSLGLWPAGWPLALQVVLAIALADLGCYATHIGAHRLRWLWPIHAPHHSARRLYWLNATRMHPLDQASTLVVSQLPLALLGAPYDALALFDAFAVLHLVLQHSNIRLRHGALSHLLATAEFHRWHHSRKRHESECNYASFFSLWDHVFRTFRMPRDAQPPEDIGLYEDAPLPTSGLALTNTDAFGEQLRAPFRAWRALRAR